MPKHKGIMLCMINFLLLFICVFTFATPVAAQSQDDVDRFNRLRTNVKRSQYSQALSIYPSIEDEGLKNQARLQFVRAYAFKGQATDAQRYLEAISDPLVKDTAYGYLSQGYIRNNNVGQGVQALAKIKSSDALRQAGEPLIQALVRKDQLDSVETFIDSVPAELQGYFNYRYVRELVRFDKLEVALARLPQIQDSALVQHANDEIVRYYLRHDQLDEAESFVRSIRQDQDVSRVALIGHYLQRKKGSRAKRMIRNIQDPVMKDQAYHDYARYLASRKKYSACERTIDKIVEPRMKDMAYSAAAYEVARRGKQAKASLYVSRITNSVIREHAQLQVDKAFKKSS